METLAQAVARELKANNVRFVVTVPDSQSRPLRAVWRTDPHFRLITACHEGEAVAIGSGLCVGGEPPLVVMENAGLFQALEAIRAMPTDMHIPLVMMIGYLGRTLDGTTAELELEHMIHLRGPAMTHGIQQGQLTEPVLRVFGIPYGTMSEPQHASLLTWAYRHAEAIRGPVAVLLGNIFQAGGESKQ